MTHTDGGQTDSLWMETMQVGNRELLAENLRVDVCVVGAGIAGLTTAYLLARENRSVVVLDDGPIGGGETGRTSAHLSSVLDSRYLDIERLHGAEGARLAAESHRFAIDVIEGIVERERIDCGFERVDGFLCASRPEDVALLEREQQAATRAGVVPAPDMVDRSPWSSLPALRFPGQAVFHPLKYVDGLAKAVESLGGRIFTRTHVQHFAERSVTTAEGRSVIADAVVIATNSPVNDRVAIHTKQAAHRTYVIGLELPKGALPHALYWDTDDPYHYLRLEREQLDADVLLVGGADHKTGQAHDTAERFTQLEAWARERFPQAGTVVAHWSGQVMEPVDHLAFLGRNPGGPEGTYIITGDAGNGLTHGTIGAQIIRDEILGRQSRWASLYDPGRVNLGAITDIAREGLNVVAQYASHISAGEVGDENEILPGHGAVVRRGLSKVAVYCKEGGELVELSAVCPHLGCIVDWNSAEKTWDCPCHGSRFDSDGRVLNGPALSDLAPWDEVTPAMTPLPLVTS